MNKSIQKKYHASSGHRQSIECHTIAQNKEKLYFNFNYINYLDLKLNEEKKINLLSKIWDFIIERKHRKFHIIITIILTLILATALFFSICFMPNGNIGDKNNLTSTIKTTQFVETTEVLTTLDYNSHFNGSIYINETERTIKIDKYTNVSLKDLFKAVDRKYEDKNFNQLEIENEYIESIDEDVLGEIRIDNITIKDCPNLKQIHCKAFGKQTQFIKQFKAYDKLPNLISIHNNEYDLYKLIYLFDGCERIDMKSFNKELQTIKLNKLKRIFFNGENSSIKIESINDYAFHEFDEIEQIGLGNNNINYISEHAFHFKHKKDTKLIISLIGNKLNESSFALNSFVRFKRPVRLNLVGNNIKYLDEKVFRPYLHANESNVIWIDKSHFDVTHYENQWNQNDGDYNRKIELF